MNILVKTASGKVIVRPDTTWKRGAEELFLPEFVNSVSYTPVIFARISKAGRSVAAKFADRYYDGICYGVLLYPDDLMDGSPEGFACASCLDRTSFLGYPVYNKVTLGQEDNIFEIRQDGKEIFRYNSATEQMIQEAIEEVTRFCYIRTGDFLAIELAPRQHLLDRKDEQTRIESTFCGNYLLDFKVVL